MWSAECLGTDCADMTQGSTPQSAAAPPVSFPAGQQPAAVTGPAAPDQEEGGGLTQDELKDLLGPIALYPDVLLAQILPASTFPTEIVMAARWLRTKPDMSKLTDQPWDPSVLALCNYPSVIEMMDKDLDWTNALGAAFLSQQQDVMNTIQDLRREAQASGARCTIRPSRRWWLTRALSASCRHRKM